MRLALKWTVWGIGALGLWIGLIALSGAMVSSRVPVTLPLIRSVFGGAGHIHRGGRHVGA